ncbi:hypothetical protein M413DRAFT_24002 [Hebeloma cylindrosporum]|uniref:HMG box domain-containing protein n=1 Tax=Hebeloma cylindrosporum TaxID=76867 RepID=A0A0C3CQ74_HEBCY|nr:hypothetical protein M413DRAFT_24002 [Hebeloma cylindrosporum h7]
MLPHAFPNSLRNYLVPFTKNIEEPSFALCVQNVRISAHIKGVRFSQQSFVSSISLSLFSITHLQSIFRIVNVKMTSSPMIIKQEEQPVPLQKLYGIAPASPPQWNFDYPVSKISAPRPFFPVHSDISANKTARDLPRQDRALDESAQREPLLPFPAPLLSSPFAPGQNPQSCQTSRPPSPSSHPPSRPRIPRPPNAFMLFRSDFLKRGVIPDHIERRQQTLSRVAGQVWNLMPKEEQQTWFDRAAQVLNEHRQKNPDYKFTPAPRNSRRGKSKLCDDSPGVSEAEVQRLREEYAQVLGPAPPSNRKRRVKKARSVEAAERVHPSPFPTSSFPAIPSLAAPGYLRDIGQSPPLISFYPMESFPKATIPRRPSTSLGFTECAKEEPMPLPDFNLFQTEFGRTASEWNVAPSEGRTSPHAQYVPTSVPSLSTTQSGSTVMQVSYAQGSVAPDRDIQEILLEQVPSQPAPPLSLPLANPAVEFHDHSLDNAGNFQTVRYGNSTFLEFSGYMNYFQNNDTDVLNSWDFQTGAIFTSSSQPENAIPSNLPFA